MIHSADLVRKVLSFMFHLNLDIFQAIILSNYSAKWWVGYFLLNIIPPKYR
jgi:hypothetical protein